MLFLVYCRYKIAGGEKRQTLLATSSTPRTTGHVFCEYEVVPGTSTWYSCMNHTRLVHLYHGAVIVQSNLQPCRQIIDSDATKYDNNDSAT
jgi:hypothetical protein